MHKHLSVYQKLSLLLNSLEALNIYEYKTLNQCKYISVIYSFIEGRQYLLDTPKIHKETIELIYKIHKKITQQYLQDIIINLLQNYTKDNKCTKTLQYLKRYKYIYQKNWTYYSRNNYHYKLNLEEIAITNLYIINQINQKQGIFLLIYYLYGMHNY